MTIHHHLSGEDILEQISAGEPLKGVAGCLQCEAEASSLSKVLSELRRADAQGGAATEWDDLLMRRRIREALANEKPHSRSIFDRFFVLRPALLTALAASIVFAVWSPVSRNGDKGGTPVASLNLSLAEGRMDARLPAWTPLPDESEDEGLAVLAEWTPNEDELAIAQCGAACLSGLSNHEEESLLRAVASSSPRLAVSGARPL